jgi:hypothetical protein
MYDIIIFNGFATLGVSWNPCPENVKFIGDGNVGLSKDDFASIAGDIHAETLIYINVHGRRTSGYHEIQLSNDTWVRTTDIFKIICKNNLRLRLFLMACFAGFVAEDETLEESLPRDSFIGLYGPRDTITLKEVSQKLTIKSINYMLMKMPVFDNFWLTAPFSGVTFVYKTVGGQIKRLTHCTSYSDIRDELTLINTRYAFLLAFNTFLGSCGIDNILIDPGMNTNVIWYKDLWFMLMVHSLKTGNKFEISAHFHTNMNENLRLYKSSLGGKNNFDLLGYFTSWFDFEIIPYLQFNPADRIILQASQDGVVRLGEKTPRTIVGLTTDKLISCVALIIVGINKDGYRRISLNHVDGTVDLGVLEEEFDFVRDYNGIDKIILAPGTQVEDSQKLTDAIVNNLKMFFLKAKIKENFSYLGPKGNVFIDRSGDVVDDIYGTRIETAANRNHRHSINMLNHVFHASGVTTYPRNPIHCGLDIQHDGESWKPAPHLSESIKKLVSTMNVDGNSTVESFLMHDEFVDFCVLAVDGSGQSMDEEKINVLASYIAENILDYCKSLPGTFGKSPFILMPNPSLPNQQEDATRLSVALEGTTTTTTKKSA